MAPRVSPDPDAIFYALFVLTVATLSQQNRRHWANRVERA
jgi:hypothetical protein